MLRVVLVAHSCIVAGLGACCPSGVALRCGAILRCTGRRARPPWLPFNGFRVNGCDRVSAFAAYSLYARIGASIYCKSSRRMSDALTPAVADGVGAQWAALKTAGERAHSEIEVGDPA